MPDRGLAYPGTRHHADAGLDNQLAFLDAALDYVADHTPADRETLYLEAVVTAWHNDDPPRTDRAAQRRPGVPRRPTAHDRRTAPPRRTARRVDELLGRPVSMRAMALLRILVGPIVLLHLRPLLDRRLARAASTATVFHEPYASLVPGAAPRRLRRACCGWPPSPRWR